MDTTFILYVILQDHLSSFYLHVSLFFSTAIFLSYDNFNSSILLKYKINENNLTRGCIAFDQMSVFVSCVNNLDVLISSC